MAPLHTKFNFQEGFQLFSDKTENEFLGVIPLNSLWDAIDTCHCYALSGLSDLLASSLDFLGFVVIVSD